GIVIADARERRRQRDAGGGERRGEKLLDYAEHCLLAREAHFEIDLREFELTVGAKVFIAEAARDLKIAVEPADHKNLLEDLWRLRQRVKLTRMHAARYQEIARTFGCGL